MKFVIFAFIDFMLSDSCSADIAVPTYSPLNFLKRAIMSSLGRLAFNSEVAMACVAALRPGAS